VERFTIIYKSSPVTNVGGDITLSPAVAGLSITDTTLYSWGADVEITNANGIDTSFVLKADGYTYEVEGEDTVEAVDQDSINKNGETILEWDSSFWIQIKPLAQILADNLVGSFADPAKDVTMNLNTGNPALLLGDKISITDLYDTIDYYMTKIQMQYNDGGWTESLGGRK
jgi:hypothetical protein